MKRYIVAIAMLILYTSCEDFLDVEPQGEPSSASFWINSEDAEAAANGLYIMNDDQSIYGRGIHLYSLIPSDDFIVGKSKAQIERIKNFQNDGTGSYTRDIWPQHYIVIKRANDIIVNVGTMDISQDDKDFIMGQAYFMRGLAYFQLSALYGSDEAGIPLIDENSETFYEARAAHVRENYAFAAENFTMAANLLPYFDALDAEDYGRPHKNAALGYLARTHLHNAQYDDTSWGKVVETCDMIINSGKNALQANFKDAFHIDNNWGSEYLWSVPSNTLGGSIFPGASLENRGWGLYNGWGYFAPTLDLYESYEDTDQRRDATILAFGDTFMYFGEERQYWSTVNWAGLQFAKYMQAYEAAEGENTNANGDHPTTDLNLPLLRYSHILLMKAEAQIMQGENGDEALNMVRNRAGLTSITNATMANLKAERRAEFAGELYGRFDDLKRWGDASEVIPNALRGREHSDKSDPNSAYTIIEIWPARTFDESREGKAWPIPPSQIDASRGTLVQNQGW